MTATYLGTRCCGASTSTPHWVGCVERLDVNDPHSYHAVRGDEVCPTCGSTETVELSDERQSITVCAQCGSDEPGIVLNDTEGEFALCGDCWEKVD